MNGLLQGGLKITKPAFPVLHDAPFVFVLTGWFCIYE